jgi:hypothetical protein
VCGIHRAIAIQNKQPISEFGHDSLALWARRLPDKLPPFSFPRPTPRKDWHIPRLCGTFGTGELFFDIRKSAAAWKSPEAHSPLAGPELRLIKANQGWRFLLATKVGRRTRRERRQLV